MTRLIVEIVLAVALISSFIAYEQHRGVAKCEAADAVAVHKQEVVNAEVHGEQVAEVKTEAETFHAEITEPVRDAPVVRVCVDPQRGSTVPKTGTTGPIDHGGTELPEENPPVPTRIEWNSEPVVRAGRDADAQVTQLQRYITQVCLK